MYMFRSLLISTFALALVAQAPAPAPKPAPAAAPAAAPVVKEDKVLATYGKESIRESDFEAFLSASVPEQQRAQLMMMPGAKDQYLKRFMDFTALAARARKENLTKSKGFAEKMKLMEMQVLIQALFERDGAALKEKSVVKDEDVKAYFDKHPEKFMTPESFSARHILVSTRAQGSEKARTDEEALTRIKLAQEALKAGKSFDDVAKEFSDDPGSKDKGGLYENIAFGRFVPEFDKAVRGQEAGKVGEPVKSMHGYHLIQVEKLTAPVAQTFEAVKDTAKQQVTAERTEAVMAAYMEEAKKMAGFHEGPAAPAAPAKAPAAKAKKGSK
jgi:parvulin-like peptidyl-prolyl isomerase